VMRLADILPSSGRIRNWEASWPLPISLYHPTSHVLEKRSRRSAKPRRPRLEAGLRACARPRAIAFLSMPLIMDSVVDVFEPQARRVFKEVMH